MLGSAAGWVEVPYAELPCTVERLAAGAAVVDAPVSGCRVHILPGVAGALDSGEVTGLVMQDVMRGEEAQAFGALQELDTSCCQAIVVLPGSHCKWLLANRTEHSTAWQIDRLATSMGGEAFQALCSHTILRHTTTTADRGVDDADDDGSVPTGFIAGLRRSLASSGGGGLLHHAFAARTEYLRGGSRDPVFLRDLLSGVVIGSEVRDMIPLVHSWIRTSKASGVEDAAGRVPVILVGSARLTRRYHEALRALDYSPSVTWDHALIVDGGMASTAGVLQVFGFVVERALRPTGSVHSLSNPAHAFLADALRSSGPKAPAVIAILRGIEPESVVAIAEALVEAGVCILEVPLNSPSPLDSISRLARRFHSWLHVDSPLASVRVLCGAGTVSTLDEANAAIRAGARLLVAPNFDAHVAAAGRRADAPYCPGVVTPTECFTAIRAGAAALKLFPAEMVRPAGLAALRAVLPPSVAVIPVGGLGTDPETYRAWRVAGASGFGVGSALFKPGMTIEQVAVNASRVVAAASTGMAAAAAPEAGGAAAAVSADSIPR